MTKLLTTTRELLLAIQSDNVAVFDCRFSLMDPAEGRQLYNESHITTAQYADLNTDLSDLSLPGGRHPLPARDSFVETVRRLGITNDTPVVCYDDGSHSYAARMWWMLRWLGHEDVTVLDGGLPAWIRREYPVDDEVPTVTPSEFVAREPLTRVRSADEVSTPGTTLLDARDAVRYRGEKEPIDPVAGHIPGAQCATFTENMVGGRFMLSDQLRKRFEDLGIDDESDITCYCGSGVTAINNIMALMLAGYPEPALYPGSWSEWITDPDRPIETG